MREEIVMKSALIILAVLPLTACSVKIREFDGIRGYEILETSPRIKIRYIEEDKRVTWEEIEALGNSACREATPKEQLIPLKITDKSVFEKQGSMSHAMLAESYMAAPENPSIRIFRGPTGSSVSMQVMYRFKKIEGHCN